MAAMLLVAVLTICLAFLTRLSFENDISKSFSSGSAHTQNYSDLMSTFGYVPKQIVVLAESAHPLEVEGYEQLRDLAFEFELVDEVESVFSLASVSFPINHAEFPDEPLLPGRIDEG